MFMFAHHNAGHTISVEAGIFILGLIIAVSLLIWRTTK